jgi:hypothetical protein
LFNPVTLSKSTDNVIPAVLCVVLFALYTLIAGEPDNVAGVPAALCVLNLKFSVA